MNSAYRRHDISDEVWMLLEPYLADQNSRHESCKIPLRKNQKMQRDYYTMQNCTVCATCHIVENTFLHLKR